MKYIFYIIFALFIFISCNSKENSIKKSNIGKLDQTCYKNGKCDNNLECIDNKCQLNLCKSITCNEVWAQCNTKNGKCDKLKDGYCLIDKHCNIEDNEVCNQETFLCEKTCNENETRCSENAQKIEICKSNKWREKETCTNDKSCQLSSNKIICKEKCTNHNNCSKKEICNNLGQCKKYKCNNDKECNNINSITNSETFYCDVLASDRTCVIFNAHTCGGEDNNDMTSKAQEIDITNLNINNNISINKSICVKDQDWYKINLKNDVNSLNFKLEFSKGDLDLIIVDNKFKTIGYSMESNNADTGGIEEVNSKFLPKGEYFIHIYRYKTSLDIDPTINSDYTLTLYDLDNTSKCSSNYDCETLKVLRSVCNIEGACEHIIANKTVKLGDLCEEKDNCNENATYGCFDMEVAGVNLDNYCTKTCITDNDCKDLNFVCQSFIITSVCMKPCTSDNDCKLITSNENSVCNSGKCQEN